MQLIWLQTLVAMNSESCQRLFPKFCAQQSEVAVLFQWNLRQTPFPVIGRQLRSGVLHWIQFATCCLFMWANFTQRPMNDWKIEWSYERCFGRYYLIIKSSIENFISHEKKNRRHFRNLQIIETFLNLKLSQHSKSGSTFSSSEPVAASGDCSRLGNTQGPVFVLASPTCPSLAGALPQELGHWFCRQNFRLSSGISFRIDQAK